jgi:hypothetical protein
MLNVSGRNFMRSLQIFGEALYVISFVLLGLHLAHGFQSSFQSIGARHPKYTPVIKAFGNGILSLFLQDLLLSQFFIL